MLKNRLEKLVVPELKLIAKKIGVKGYSTVKKKELIELILTIEEDKILSALQILEDGDDLPKEENKVESPKEKNRINWFKVLQIVIPALILLVGIINLRGCGNSELDICNVNEIKQFNDTDAFNVLILDFLDYTFCNAYAECEVEFQKRIDKINEYSHIPINSKITSCRSKDLSILNLDDAEEFCELKNADLVIFGAVENISGDSIRVNLNYTANPSLKSTLIEKTKNEKFFVVNSIFDVSQSNHDFKEIEDIINWNLAVKAQYLTDINKAHKWVRFYLNKISDYNRRNYSNAKLIEGHDYLVCERDYKKAEECFIASINRDSLNSEAYRNLALTYVILNNEEMAVKNMQYHSYIKFQESDTSFAALFDSNYTVHQLLKILDSEKQYNVGYSVLVRNLLKDKSYLTYIPQYFNAWEEASGIDKIKEALEDDFEYVKSLSEVGNFLEGLSDSLPPDAKFVVFPPNQEEFNKHIKSVSSTPK